MAHQIKVEDTITIKHLNNKKCIVTAIMLKGKGYKEYQCSYEDDGKLVSSWLSRCEIEPTKTKDNKFGFGNA